MKVVLGSHSFSVILQVLEVNNFGRCSESSTFFLLSIGTFADSFGGQKWTQSDPEKLQKKSPMTRMHNKNTRKLKIDLQCIFMQM